MKNRLIFLICSILFVCSWAQGQVVKGIVSENGKDQPIPAASVFINNSTYGAICDENGQFVIGQHPEFPFELVVTAIGYESRTMTVTAGAAPLSIKLVPKVFDLGEVNVISPEKDGWQRFGKTFLEEFIGYSVYAAECTLLNKEDIRFYWDRENMVLRASADVPLKIRNNATGYLITYWLEDFELDYITRKLYFRGYSRFEAIPSKRSGKTAKWKANRLKAYNGSLYHFMCSLYKGDALAEGFEIRALKRIAEDEAGKYIPVWSDTLAFKEAEKTKKLMLDMYGPEADPSVVLQTLMRIRSWFTDSTQQLPLRLKGSALGDSTMVREFRFVKPAGDSTRFIVRYFESHDEDTAATADAAILDEQKHSRRASVGITDAQSAGGRPVLSITGKGDAPGQISLSPELAKILPVSRKRTLDMLFTAIVPPDSIISHEAGKTRLRFNDYLHITYLYETGDREYYLKRAPGEPPMPEKQESIISISPGKSLLIMPEGNFSDSYDLLVERYWSYEKLDKLLPIDFEPE